ncbi:ead/Ea22-like family protein [Escherichia coli]|nr:ead/Ea22-like family protein [Escherichia coli]
MSKIDYQALREKAEKATCGEWSLEYGDGRFDGDDALIHREAAGYIPICRIEGAHPESGFDEDFQMEQQANAEFIAAANPATVLVLLDERERNQQYIKRRDQENEDIALTVGKLRVELEAAENNLIDSECHVAELEEALRDKQALLEASEKRIAELEAREIKPAKGEVLVVVSGFTGCGKSAIAGEIEIAMKAIGVPVQWTNGDAEKRMTGADWLTAIEMYKPTVRIVEVNVPRVAGICIKGDAGEQNDEKP